MCDGVGGVYKVYHSHISCGIPCHRLIVTLNMKVKCGVQVWI